MIVDDDNSVNLLYQYFLKLAYGGQILSASDGREAIKYCETQQPELIFMDIQMPVKDGFETIAELRDGGFSNPIVIMTSSNIQNGQYRDLPVNRILQKPVNRFQMIEQLDLI